MADVATNAPVVTTMADLLGKTLPALSATNDMPVVEAAPVVEPVVTADPPAVAETELETVAAAPKSEAGDKPQVDPDPDVIPADLPAYAKREITKARNQRRAAEEKAAAAEKAAATAAEERAVVARALEALTPKPAEPEAPVAQPKPARDAFETPEAYDDALIAWARTEGAISEAKRLETKQAEDARTTAADARKVDLDNALQGFAARRETAMAEIADYVAVAESQDVRVSEPMAEAIVRADNGPQIAYHLGKNPAEAERIAALPPGAQLFEIGRLSARLAVPTPAPKRELTRAPDPIVPLGSRSGATEKAPDEQSMDEYAAAAERRLYPHRFRNGAQPRPH